MRRSPLGSALVLLCLFSAACSPGWSSDTSQKHGRKYKAPPETSHIEVLVTKQASGKPVANAAVIFRATTPDGKDDGNLEVKTDPDGEAVIDVINRGSRVLVQVFANGMATYAENFQVDEASRTLRVALTPPQEQVSAYEDNTGKSSSRTWGVQEPRTPPKTGATPAAPALKRGPKPGAATTAAPSTNPAVPEGAAPTAAPQTPPPAAAPETQPAPKQ